MILSMGRKLAILAHRAAIEEIAEIQHRQVLRYSVTALHGERALPLREFMRRIDPQQQSLADAARLTEVETKADATRLEDLYAIVEALEAAFVEYQTSDAAFSAAMAEHFRRAQ